MSRAFIASLIAAVAPETSARLVDTWTSMPQLTEPANLPPPFTQLQPAIGVGDHLHLNPLGYKALADAVPAWLLRG
jgi:lysophospholipase L1-like esterase